jgi:hypothetical protein
LLLLVSVAPTAAACPPSSSASCAPTSICCR